jgi:dipeptidyl aminopeptidase/acylaminoacyl peptidase
MTEVQVPAAATSREETFELLQQLRRPAEVELSPDGTRIAFTVVPISKEKDGVMETRLWFGDVDGESSPAAAEASAQAVPRFSPDGSQLAYASDDEHAGRMTLRIHGKGELGSIAGSVEDIRWSPDGASLLVLAADLGSDRAGAQTATKIEEKDHAEEDPIVVRPAQHWRRLFVVETASGDTREVSPEGVNVFEFDWAGEKAVAVCTDEPSEGAWYTAWIGLIDLDTRTVERAYTPEWQLQCPTISTGGRVAWIEGFASDRATVHATVYLLGSGPLAPELDVSWISFADEDTLWYAGRRRNDTIFGRLGLDGAVEEITGGEFVIGSRHQSRVSPSADGTRVAFPVESGEQPAEVVLFENGSMRTLTGLNAELAPRLQLADYQSYSWESFDGLEIDGLLALPKGRGDGPLPLVTYVHGGPTAGFSWAGFSQANGHVLALAEAGYAVFMPNPRGSIGRGQEFARGSLADMGGADLKDILAGIDALVADGVADDDRVAITGGSYGGFMSSWAPTQTDRFAAAMPFAICADWLSLHLTTNIREFCEIFLGDDPYKAAGEYTRRSPIYHAKKCKTPTLIFEGQDDLCTPVSQGWEFYNALVEAGCETELVIYPREGHGWYEREHQIDWWQRTIDWCDRYLA